MTTGDARARSPGPAAPDLEPPVRRALRRLVIQLADSKRILGIRYSDWVLGAPSLEANIATSSMAQDEWGHARLLYAMLKDLGEDPEAVEHDRPAEEYASIGVLDAPFGDWAEVVAGIVLVDGALTAALEGFAQGTYQAARSRVPKMVAEEAFHRDLGAAWFRRLAGGSAEARSRLAEAGGAIAPLVLAWLDPADEPSSMLAEAGVTAPPATSVDRFVRATAALAHEVDLDLEALPAAREGWDTERGRGPGHPGLEAVERARGDRNRVLFVE